MKKLENYIQQHEDQRLSLSRSRLQSTPFPPAAVAPPLSSSRSARPSPLRMAFPSTSSHSSTPPAPPLTSSSRLSSITSKKGIAQRQEVKLVDVGPDGSVGRALEGFISSLKHRAAVRAHDFKQLQRLLVADLDWDCDLSLSAQGLSRWEHEEDDFEALLLGEALPPPPPPLLSPPRRQEEVMLRLNQLVGRENKENRADLEELSFLRRRPPLDKVEKGDDADDAPSYADIQFVRERRLQTTTSGSPPRAPRAPNIRPSFS
eukprot:scaffold2798_cov160-Ochromonas_danica.AAC.37